MDEHDDNQQPDTTNEDTHPLLTERHSANGNEHTVSSHPNRTLALPQLTPTAKVALQRRPATEIDLFALRRARLNRLLMRKRRLGRDEKDIVPRLVLILAVLLILLISFLSSGVGVAYAYYDAQLPLLTGIAQHSLFQTTRIYDRNGKLLYELYDHQTDRGRRTYIDYPDISPLLINATIAAEDHTFWTNSGVDFYGIARAAVSDLQRRSLVEGGSTITQQLIKKQFFDTQGRTFQVKGEEAILATGLTNQYPKWKIMEMYLNTIYYGDLNYGAEAAAEGYFGLQPKCTHTHCIPAVSQLDLAQASLLAGLPQSPSYYNPTINKQTALDRQKDVLNQMKDLGMITDQQVQQAEDEMAKFHFRSYSDTHPIRAPHFVQYVINQVLIPLLGAQNVEDGGYNVYTTLDLDLEKKVEDIVYSHLYKTLPTPDPYLGDYGPLSITHNVNNGAVVVMNPFNGEILAMDGSANYDQNTPQMQGQFNATLSPRQPGSSFKPVVYSTAFEMGWYPAMIIPDHKTIYPGNDKPPYYTPQNYDGTFHTGFPMTVRNAIANSFNIPAIDAIEYTGIPNVLNMAGRLGLTEVANKPLADLGPSMAIGSTEVSLLHLTGAYATFANQGVRVPATAVLEITDNQGHAIYRLDEAHPHGQQVVSKEVAFLMSSILSDNAARIHEFGLGNPLQLDRPAAAKTGTTDSFRDNWTLGYTPYLTVGVWVGNSDNSIMNGVIGITGAGPIWHDVMEYASQRYNYPPNDFIKPNDVVSSTVSALTGLMPRFGEPTVTDWFIDGTQPTLQSSDYTPPPNCRRNRCKCNGDGCPPPPNP